MGPAKGGAGPRGGGGVLDALRMELDGGGDSGGRSDDMHAVFLGPDGKHEVRGGGVEGGGGAAEAAGEGASGESGAEADGDDGRGRGGGGGDERESRGAAGDAVPLHPRRGIFSRGA